jgi:hypothetical protein
VAIKIDKNGRIRKARFPVKAFAKYKPAEKHLEECAKIIEEIRKMEFRVIKEKPTIANP